MFTRLVCSFAALLLFCATAMAGTLQDVKGRDRLVCGVNPGLQGFAAPTPDRWWGFDVDFCRAVAAAVLADPLKVDFVPLNAEERFAALSEGRIDVLARNTTWTMEREAKLGLRFAGISYHDGQGFIVKKLLGVTSALNLSGAAICFLTGTTTQANVEDFFREKEMTFTPITFNSIDALVKAFDEGQCDTYTADLSQLHAVRLRLKDPDDSIVLPDAISKEPLGPAVRQGDDEWLDIVRWTLFALIDAEELGVTSKAAGEMAAQSKNPAVRRMLGVEGTFGADLGLDANWALRAITAVGHYGEIFERNLGKDSPLQIGRGMNAPWNAGGLLYAPPIR